MTNLVSVDFPLVADLLPHNEPMILLDKLIFADNEKTHCQVYISENSPFYDEGLQSVGAWVGIEYMAQAIAAWSGYRSSLKNEVPQIGFLLGTRRYSSEVVSFKKGQCLDIYTDKLLENEGMGAVACSIACEGETVVTAQLNVFSPNKEQLEEMLKGKTND